MRQPYKCGDILYVRETFVEWCGEYGYKASAEQPELWTGWKPSIHMPKEAARIFLRVTDVRMERLREITADEIFKEGIQADYIFSAFDTIWDSTIKPADRSAYGWEANPWVWVIEFERISKEATLCQAD